MTREEAIDILFGVIAANSEEENEALDMAIEALQAKTDGDLISRQDAIETVCRTRCGDKAKGCPAHSCPVIEEFDALPSAEPKTGMCSGCKCLGSYDSDFPCVNCVRITKDYYCGTGMRGEEE